MIIFKKIMKTNQVSKIKTGNIMVKSRQKFPNRGAVQNNQKIPKYKRGWGEGGRGGISELGNTSLNYNNVSQSYSLIFVCH